MKDVNIKIINSFPDPNKQRFTEKLWFQQHGESIVLINCESRYIEYPEHWTPLSIKCVMAGKEFYHFSRKSYAVNHSNFLILNEGCIYKSSIETEQPTESFSLNFTRKNIEEVFTGITGAAEDLLDNPFKRKDQPLPFIEKLYPHKEQLSRLLLHARDLSRANRLQDLTIELFYGILENMIYLQNETYREINRFPGKKRSTKLELYKRLHIARDVMDSCYDQEITLDHLGHLCLLNSFYLLRGFKKVFGTTPHQYLLHRRLKEAEKMLLNRQISITDIIRLVGFKDLSSFSKAFKKYADCAPDKFRKQFNNQDFLL